MSVAAVLDAVYSTLAARADVADDTARLWAKEDDPEPTARRDLDRLLGLDGPEIGEADTVTNVVDLRAFIDRVNTTMR